MKELRTPLRIPSRLQGGVKFWLNDTQQLFAFDAMSDFHFFLREILSFKTRRHVHFLSLFSPLLTARDLPFTTVSVCATGAGQREGRETSLGTRHWRFFVS